jgi:hypothetical protein
MDEPAADPGTQRALLTLRSEYVRGCDRLLALARRELRIFDPDLAELDLNSTVRIEALTCFLRASRAQRVFIALHDVEHVARHCPRILKLLGNFPSGIVINRTQGEAARVQDCFVLADGDHLVRRPVTHQRRGVLVLNDAKECQPMRERFDEIWESSAPGVSANTSGL